MQKRILLISGLDSGGMRFKLQMAKCATINLQRNLIILGHFVEISLSISVRMETDLEKY